MRGADNSRRIRHCKFALKKAILNCLSESQRKYILEYYWREQRKSQIARKYGVSCSAVGKALKQAEAAIRQYVEQYMRIYDAVERDLLNEF